MQTVVVEKVPEKHFAKTPVKFDGRRVHGTDSFIEIRYSLVFFSVRGAEAASSLSAGSMK